MSTEKTQPVDLTALSPKQMKDLMKQLEQKQKEQQKETAEKRNAYKKNVDATVSHLFPLLQSASEALGKVKAAVFTQLDSLKKEKAEVYGKEEDQTSHSFTNSDGSITIIIGYNMIDGWDDTANTGMAKANEYLKSLGKDRESKMLVESITKLLSKDSKGNLKASRVLQLKQIAERTGNKNFIDAINIIHDAYRPTRSKEFVRCIYKNNTGEQLILPLSITDAALEKLEAQ